jgi:hypothetical protein
MAIIPPTRKYNIFNQLCLFIMAIHPKPSKTLQNHLIFELYRYIYYIWFLGEISAVKINDVPLERFGKF